MGNSDSRTSVNASLKDTTVHGSVTVASTAIIHNPPLNQSNSEFTDNELTKLESEFRGFFSEKILEFHASIPIPASYTTVKIKDAVLNLRTIRKTTNEDDKDLAREQAPEMSGFPEETTAAATEGMNRTQTQASVSPKGSDSDSEELSTGASILCEYDSDSSESSEGSIGDTMPLEFSDLCEAIESEAKGNNKLIFVGAPGGRGKTTTARKVMWHWGQGDYLQRFSVVAVIDAKKVDCVDDIFDNFVKQYAFVLVYRP